MTVDYKKEDKIAIFTINRPQVRNAMDMETLRRFGEVLQDFSDDPELWVGIITGAGDKAFCAGADIKDTLPFMKEHRDNPSEFPATLMRGLVLWKPLIAAINGAALGGGLEVALACDIRIASENAHFGTPEITLGMIPGWGGTQRLPRIVPWCKAAEILLMGRPIDAQEAYRIGLVNKVVTPEKLMSTAMEWAGVICQAAPLAVRAAKQAMISGASLTLEDGLQLESSLESYLLGTEDFAEATAALAEKRKPVYKAR